jgi:putative addiction module killer protein
MITPFWHYLGQPHMLLCEMIVVVEYEDEDGAHPFSTWFKGLNVPAALKVRTAIARMETGNFFNVEPVGQGVSEYKLEFGPGYRIYFGKDGDTLVVLLGGGTKKRQSRDIEAAIGHWAAYKIRKKKG